MPGVSCFARSGKVVEQQKIKVNSQDEEYLPFIDNMIIDKGWRLFFILSAES